MKKKNGRDTGLFTVSQPDNNPTFFLEFDNQYYLTSTFMRLQEFYESPFDNIRGNYFTVEQFMDTYVESKKTKEFTYYTDWSGFNVPGHVIEDFKVKFKGKLTEREKLLINYFKYANLFDHGYYVIGAVRGNSRTLEHELCHARYYLRESFKKSSDELIYDPRVLPVKIKEGLSNALIEKGYSEGFIDDEINAYLSTCSSSDISRIFKMSVPKKVLGAFRHNYDACTLILNLEYVDGVAGFGLPKEK